MKKLLSILFFSLFSAFAFSQGDGDTSLVQNRSAYQADSDEAHFSFLLTSSSFSENDCGTWEVGQVLQGEWITLDTIGEHPIGEDRDWLYDESRLIGFDNRNRFLTLANYQPCGGGNDTVYKQRRVCLVTGILQEQTTVVYNKYVPKPPTAFEAVLEDLKKPRK